VELSILEWMVDEKSQQTFIINITLKNQCVVQGMRKARTCLIGKIHELLFGFAKIALTSRIAKALLRCCLKMSLSFKK
jgi:hypothetical protein